MEEAVEARTKRSNEKLPSVSVVIPAFNSEGTIGQTIESLKDMNYPQERLEIIVVDDLSDDKTAEVALGYGVRVVRREKRGGCAGAKNTGVDHARNEIIAFVDSNVITDKNWLKELVKPFEDPAVGATGGFIETKFLGNSALGKYEDYDSHYRKRRASTGSVPGSNSAYRREVFEVVGELDPYLGEDPDFCYRVLSHGYKAVFNEKAVVHHPQYNDILTYLRKQVYYGWQRTLIFLLRPQSRGVLLTDEHTSWNILLQPFVLGVMILSLLLVPVFGGFVFVSLFLFLLFMMLNAPFLRFLYAKEARLLFFGLFLAIPRAFAYILGLAWGIISFMKVKATGKGR